MKISTSDALNLACGYLTRHGMPEEHARAVADHLVYATFAGHAFAGLPRLLPIVERFSENRSVGPITTVRETDKSAMIDGGDVNGYVTSVMGMDKAVSLAKKSGVGIVGVSNSWFSGLLRYYAERAAREDLIAIVAANTAARVAPHGGADRILGTNPLAFAFPAPGAPLVTDFATTAMMWGDVLYHQELGKALPPGIAVDQHGSPTVDPASALAGAFKCWGGTRGYALSVAVQALGILGGSDAVISESGRWGYLFIAIDPGLLMPVDQFKERVGQLRDGIESSRPSSGHDAVRAPGSGSQERLEAGRTRGWIELDDLIYSKLIA